MPTPCSLFALTKRSHSQLNNVNIRTRAEDYIGHGLDNHQFAHQTMNRRRPYSSRDHLSGRLVGDLESMVINPIPIRAAQSPEDDGELRIPDCGIRAWLVVLGGFLGFATGYGMINSWGTFQAFYAAAWPSKSLVSINWIGSLQPGLLFLMGCIVEPAFGRWGARPVMVMGSVFYIMSFMLASFSNTFWHYLVTQGVLLGIANDLLFYLVCGAIAGWFDRNHGLALGIAVSGSSVGGICWPILINDLLHVFDLRWTHRILALVSLPLLVAACVLVKERKPPTTHRTSRGFLQSMKQTKYTICRSNYMALKLAIFLVFLVFLIPFSFKPLHAQYNGATMTMANAYLSICYSGSVVGGISSGWMADHLGRFNILTLFCSLAGTISMVWIRMDTDDSMGTVAFLYGVCSGAIAPLVPTCVAQTSAGMGTVGPRLRVMMALCSVGVVGSGLVGGALLGFANDNSRGYMAAFRISRIAALTGGIMFCNCDPTCLRLKTR